MILLYLSERILTIYSKRKIEMETGGEGKEKDINVYTKMQFVHTKESTLQENLINMIYVIATSSKSYR